MAGHEELGSRVRAARQRHGLTQTQLAVRAGVTRQLLGAVETGRHLPRVDAAAAIARVLGTDVESLLAPAATPVVGVLATPREGEAVRVAKVGQQIVALPAMPAGESWSPADARVRDGRITVADPPPATAVVAGCDPAIGLLARSSEADDGPTILAASGSSAAARDALEAGRTHAAVVHAAVDTFPDAPPGVHRWCMARWQVGLAAPHELPASWVDEALAGGRDVVQRESGAASQAAFARATAAAGHGLPAGPRAGGHLEAATIAARSGLVAVTIEPAALALGLAFHPLEEHVTQLWVLEQHLDVPALHRFLDELGGRPLRERLEGIGGYDLTDTGTRLAA